MRLIHRSLSVGRSQMPLIFNNPDAKYTASSKRVGLVTKKMGMMSIWDEWGVFTPVTILKAVENQVIKTTKHENGTFTVEVGVDRQLKSHRLRPSFSQIFSRYGVPTYRRIYGFQVSPDAVLPSGLKLGVHHFVPGQYIDVQSTSIGKGFQGGMKRWGFKGLPASHGVSLAHRSIGSTGNRHDPGKVFKGKKMPGRMGGDTISVQSLRILKIDTVYNLIYVKGCIPGPDESYVRLKDAVRTGWFDETFPKGSKVPFPTNFNNLSELPRELTIDLDQVKELDPLSRQRKERTG